LSIRGKLKDFKNRLSDRKMYTITIVVVALVASWGIYQYKNAANLRQELDNQYNRSFYDMVGYVDNVQALLIKSLITSTPNATATTMQEAWRQANMAQTNLGQLPVSQHVLANTAKFLSQVGDLAYSINHKNMEGKNLDDKQYKMIEDLHGYAVTLNQSLNDLQNLFYFQHLMLPA
jgi:spore germination protein